MKHLLRFARNFQPYKTLFAPDNLKMLRQLSFEVFNAQKRLFSSSVSSAKSKWNIVASVCLQRKPVINKELTDFEKRVQELLFKLEKENSWKSDWELEIEKELRDLEQIKKGSTDKIGRKLRRDWEDEWKAERKNFQLQPRITEEDKKKDVKSWNRVLDHTLFLVVQQKDYGNRWIFPHGNHVQGETMREAAERILRESCGENLKAQFYGNAPCGFYKLKYPQTVTEKEGVEGEKVFFYKAYLTGGTLKSSPILKDFKWVVRNDLHSTLSEDYCQSIEMFLFDED